MKLNGRWRRQTFATVVLGLSARTLFRVTSFAAVVTTTLISPAAASESWAFVTNDRGAGESYIARIDDGPHGLSLTLSCSKFRLATLSVGLWGIGDTNETAPGGTTDVVFVFHTKAMFSNLSSRFDATRTLHASAVRPDEPGRLTGSSVAVSGEQLADVLLGLSNSDSVDVKAGPAAHSFTLAGAADAIPRVVGGCPIPGGDAGKAAADQEMSYDGIFRVVMPGDARRISRSIQTNDGSLQMRGFAARAGGRIFSIEYSDEDGRPDDDARMRALETMRNGMVRGSGGKLITVSTLPGAGDAGEGFAIALPSGGTDRVELIAKGGKQFVLQVISPSGADDERVAEAFFASLRIP